MGLGWAGQQHLEAYAARPDVQVVALAGLEADLLASLGTAHGARHLVARWQDLLDVEGLQAVSIAVPTALHAPIAVAALQRGLHVLCEKPIARDAPEAATMVEAARTAGRVLDVVFNHRQRGDVQALRQLVASGELGRPYAARAWWLRRRGIPMLGSWFTNAEASGGGPLVDIGVHCLDWALHVLGEPRVVAASAVTFSELGPRGLGGSRGGSKSLTGAASAYEVEDLAHAFLRLEGGGLLQLETSWAMFRETEDQLGMTVTGTDGGAELVVRGAPAPVGDLRVFTDSPLTADGEAADRTVPVRPGRGHAAVVDAFVGVVRGDPSAWKDHDGSLALDRARVIDACYASARQNREVVL
ncbi:Predicted dehydrogenase [Quadrisphaera granulorum]|uniref:Putative dehydrogenase n=1 Tax=Quadrisphaera granulorum TaxID=317664 RepID=A0A316A4V1_9ACTN|nr:putative dehydrogenase [Quadrisphaera granulorum]SZE97547.1 Predicted dehydrogenase [Quadrisphaera granulorum]